MFVWKVAACLRASDFYRRISEAGRQATATLLQRACRLHAGRSRPRDWRLPLLAHLSRCEREVERAASLSQKLPHHPHLVASLLADPALETEAEVPPADRPALVRYVYGSGGGGGQDGVAPEPDLSEYILRAVSARPEAAGSLPVVHRMYVARRPPDQWRLAVALGVDHAA